MKNLRIFYSCFFLLNVLGVVGQVYYGDNKFGKIQFINDSTIDIHFIHRPFCMIRDTGIVERNGDTLFVTTKETWKYKLVDIKKEECHVKNSIPTICKIYWTYKNEHEFEQEIVAEKDLEKNLIYVNYFTLPVNYILILNNYGMYSRTKIHIPNDEYCCLIFKYNNTTINNNLCVFDRFPLIKRGNRLIPINDTFQEQCWLDNGFFFPKMKISKKKKYYVINDYSVGLQNMPCPFDKIMSKEVSLKYYNTPLKSDKKLTIKQKK